MKPSLEMLLRQENQQLRDAQVVIAGFLVGLLQEQHSGRAFVSLSTLAEVQSKPYQIKGVPQPELGNIALIVIGPDGKERIMDDAKPPALPEFPVEVLPPDDELEVVVPCGDPWHSSSDRVGFLCPGCGSSEVAPQREGDAGIDVDTHKET